MEAAHDDDEDDELLNEEGSDESESAAVSESDTSEVEPSAPFTESITEKVGHAFAVVLNLGGGSNPSFIIHAPTDLLLDAARDCLGPKRSRLHRVRAHRVFDSSDGPSLEVLPAICCAPEDFYGFEEKIAGLVQCVHPDGHDISIKVKRDPL